MYSELFRLDGQLLGKYDESKYPCRNCSLPIEYLGNISGECNLCKKAIIGRTFRGEVKFKQDIAATRNNKLAVTVSGGKDSIYAWMKAVETFGNDSVVAISYIKSGISHPLAINNILRAKEILGSDVIFVEDTDSKDRLIRMLSVLLANPNAGMIRPLLCAGCRNGITRKLYDKCKMVGIKKALSAASYLELAPFKNELLISNTVKSSKEGFYFELNKYVNELQNDDIQVMTEDLELEYKNNVSKGYPSLFDGIEIYDFDWYFENDPYKFENCISKKLRWERDDKSWHFDCQIEMLKDMFYYGMLGYTEADFKLSSMIRDKKISRTEAILQIEYYNFQIKNSKDKIIKFISTISSDDKILERIDEFFKTYIEKR